jgi:hypothetical protein
MRQEYYCEAEKDLFDAGFFFALGQFLSLSRRCKRGEGNKIEEQILQTSKELDL